MDKMASFSLSIVSISERSISPSLRILPGKKNRDAAQRTCRCVSDMFDGAWQRVAGSLTDEHRNVDVASQEG